MDGGDPVRRYGAGSRRKVAECPDAASAAKQPTARHPGSPVRHEARPALLSAVDVVAVRLPDELHDATISDHRITTTMIA